MNIATSPNGSTEAGRDFVITKIDMCATPGAVCRCGGVTAFVFPLTFETRHGATSWPAPKSLESLGRSCFRRWRNLLFCAQLQLRFRRRWGKRTAALAAHRAFRRHILHLLKATMRTFHIGLGRRRLDH